MIEPITTHPPVQYVLLAEKLERLLEKKKWAIVDESDDGWTKGDSITTEELASLLKEILCQTK